MRRVNFYRTGFLGLLAITAMVFWNCLDANTSDKSVTLSLQLSDSLSVQNGLYDSVRIDIYDGSKKIFKAAIFHGPYDKNANKETLSNLNLGVNPPNPMAVKITAYRKNGDILTISFDVNNNVSGNPNYKIVSLAIDPNKPSDTTSKPPVKQPVDTTNPNTDSLPIIIPPESVVIDTKGPLVLAVSGVSVELQSRVLPVTANPTVEWFSADSGIADIVNGNSVKPIAIGKTTLIVRSKEDPSKFKTLEVKVQAEPITVKKVTITNSRPFKISTSNSNVALEASIEPLGAVRDVNWSSSDTSIAIILGNQIKGLKVGSSKITARSISDPGIFDTITVEVQVGAIDPTSLEIRNGSAIVLIIGNPNTELKTTILPSGADPSVVWTSMDITVVSIENGTYAKGNKAGETILTATSKVNSSLKKTIVVKVQSAVIKPKSVTITVPDPMNLAPNGIEGDLAAKIEPADAKPDVIWESKDTSIVKITAANKAKPVKVGSTKIIVKSKQDPTLSDTLTVDVSVPVKVEGITVNPKTMKLYTGGDSLEVIVALIGNDPGAKYALNSSNSTIASIRSDGFVKGLKAGFATISATIVGATLSDSCKVEVLTDAPVVTVTDNSPITYNGEAVFTVTVTQAFGKTLEISADMDGNGAFDTSIANNETAIFKKKYSANTVVAFEARDTEGNKTKVTRNMVVQAPGAPIVKITAPTGDITIKEIEYPITFTVADPALGTTVTKDSTVKGLKGGSNLITVARINSGGKGEATLSITVDSTAPFVLITPPPNLTVNTPVISLAGKVSDGVAGIKSVAVSIEGVSAGDAVLTTGNWTKSSLTLKEGQNDILVTATDTVGNTATATLILNLDTTIPGAVTFTGSDNAFTSNDTPTWTWSPSATNGGVSIYELALDAQAAFTVTTTNYTPTSKLPDNATHTLTVRQRDQVESVYGAAKSFRYQVKVNPANAPSVKNSGTTMNGGSTNNLNFTWESGGGGNGTYRVRINSETTYRESNNTTKGWSLPSNSSDGSYTIRISELDALNRWSTEGTFAIVLDRTGPTVQIQTRNGIVTSATKVSIQFRVDNITQTPSDCKLDVSKASTICLVTANDNLGNVGKDSIAVNYRPNVTFFTPNGSINGKGDSWETARSFRGDLTSLRGELWVQSGSYTMPGDGLQLSNVKVYGGLRALAISNTDAPDISTLGATEGGKVIVESTDLSLIGFTGTFSDAAVLIQNVNLCTFTKCRFFALTPNSEYAGIGVNTGGRNASFIDCLLNNETGGEAMISNSRETGILKFKNCTFGSSKYDGVNDIKSANQGAQTIRFDGINNNGVTPKINNMDIVCGIEGTTQACTEF